MKPVLSLGAASVAALLLMLGVGAAGHVLATGAGLDRAWSQVAGVALIACSLGLALAALAAAAARWRRGERLRAADWAGLGLALAAGGVSAFLVYALLHYF